MKEAFSLLLIPDPHFSKQLASLKHQLTELIGRDYPSSRAPAHLSICSFRLKSGTGTELCAFIDILSLKAPALNLSCQGFASFSQTRTLYLNLAAPEIFTAFQKEFKHTLKEAFPPLKRNMSLASQPHITIGRNLKVLELEAALQHFQNDFNDLEFKGQVLRLLINRMGRMEMYKEWNLSAGI